LQLRITARPPPKVIRQLYTDAAALGIYLATVGRLAVESAMAASQAEETAVCIRKRARLAGSVLFVDLV
jgi:hypothetical protein